VECGTRQFDIVSGGGEVLGKESGHLLHLRFCLDLEEQSQV
jgi:hypothetical protein